MMEVKSDSLSPYCVLQLTYKLLFLNTLYQSSIIQNTKGEYWVDEYGVH